MWCLSWANCEKSLQIHEQINLVKVCVAKKFHITIKINHMAYIKQLSLHTFRGQITIDDGNLQHTLNHDHYGGWWTCATCDQSKTCQQLDYEIRYDPSYNFFFPDSEHNIKIVLRQSKNKPQKKRCKIHPQVDSTYNWGPLCVWPLKQWPLDKINL